MHYHFAMDALQRSLLQLTTLLPGTSRRWHKLLDARLLDFQIGSASVVPLVMLARSGGGLNQAALAERVGVVGPALVRTLDTLDDLGLVRREADPEDRRAKRLHLTEAGTALVERLEARLLKVRNEVFAGIGVQEIQAALHVHQALITALQANAAAAAAGHTP